jgi:hypothetical protein
MRRHRLLAVLAALCFGVVASPALADNRVALVIGNGAYAHVPHLPNPSHDAEDVAAALKRTGFQTIVGIDLDQAGMQDAAIRFARAARTADVAIFYYSGHALQFAGVNYMVPIDAQLRDEADLRRMTRVDEVVADLQQAKNLRILVLDSCRDNPLADELKRSIGVTRSAGVGRGLAKIDSPEGMIVAYATQAGRTADDGDGRNSPYTAAFLRNVEAQEEIGTIFRRISADVYQTTRQTQLPELSLSLIGEFYLNGKSQVTTVPTATPAQTDPCAAAESHWKSAEAIGTVDVYQDHIGRFPRCTFAALAKARIESLKSKVAVATLPTAPTSPAPQSMGPNPSRQRAVLYDENPANPKDTQYVGSVIWRTEPVKPVAGQKADIAVRADIDIPDRRFKMTMSFRRNTDASLPASHIAELTFILPPDFAGGGVAKVPGMLVKSNEQARGVPLAGLSVKVTDGFFLVGFSNTPANRERNVLLLRDPGWFDVPLVYGNQRRAILAIEKGLLGERAFAAWAQSGTTSAQ